MTGWAALAEEMVGCTACGLAATRTQVVPGVAPRDARVVLIGEAPGRAEDEGGLPFVGRSGRLLDELLDAAGLHRDQLAIVNTVKCRPPANRTPKRIEATTCRPWLDRQVRFIDPDVVVTLGGSALAWALGTGRRLRDARGQVHRLRLPGSEQRSYQMVATYHPAAALRFGPAGEPRLALAADLQLAAGLVAR